MKSEVSGQSRAAKVRALKTRVTSPQVARGPVAREPRAPTVPQAPKKDRVLCSENLRSWLDRRKKVTH